MKMTLRVVGISLIIFAIALAWKGVDIFMLGAHAGSEMRLACKWLEPDQVPTLSRKPIQQICLETYQRFTDIDNRTRDVWAWLLCASLVPLLLGLLLLILKAPARPEPAP